MCKFCNLLSGEMSPLIDEGCLMIERHNNTYSIVAENIQDDDESIINYCPMCGRKLGEQDVW